MNEYKVSKERLIKETPDKIIEKGIANFGTFNNSFTNLNLLDVNKQSKFLPNFLNKKRLTEWEAFELDFLDATIVAAVYKNLCLNGMGIVVYYDKKENKLYNYRVITHYKKVHIANNLIDSITYIKTKKFELSIYNDFNNKKAKVIAKINNKRNGLLSMNLELNQFSPSSIVSIPLGENKPLYSEKAIFKVKGKLIFNNQEYTMDENSSAIIDDHKGYYPYRTHYDWLTTMGKINHNGNIIRFGFNLTKNQSIDENKYNENLIWIEDKSFVLPPVKFIKKKDKWLIKDDYDMVHLEFNINRTYKMGLHALLIDIKYHLPFGYINGYVKNIDGETFKIDHLIGIAEDKSTHL